MVQVTLESEREQTSESEAIVVNRPSGYMRNNSEEVAWWYVPHSIVMITLGPRRTLN